MDVSTLSTTTVYRKTAKGFAEIETRANRLPLRQRSVLIMVDGRMADRDLRRVIGDAAEALLKELLAAGYIEPIGGVSAEARPSSKPPSPVPAASYTAGSGVASSGTPPAAQPPAPADAAATFAPPPPAAPAVAEIPAMRREAVRQLTDQIGPMAETLAIKIESARTWTELRPLLVIGAQMLANTRGRSAAEAFAQRFIVV